eukprot:6220930-Pyramimonas_sp.AAC.1
MGWPGPGLDDRIRQGRQDFQVWHARSRLTRSTCEVIEAHATEADEESRARRGRRQGDSYGGKGSFGQ